MTATLDEIVERPYMLNDIAVDAQRLSAVLPPDNWDPETHKPTRLERQPSGVLDLVRCPSSDDAKGAKLTVNVSKPAVRDNGDTVSGATSKNKSSSWWASACLWLRRRFSKHRDEG